MSEINQINVYPVDFDVQFEESNPEWLINDVIYELSLKANYLDVYAGVIEYDPGGIPTVVHAGEIVHEKGSKYICRALSQQTITPPMHLPETSNDHFQVYTILTYIEAYVKEHADALIYKGVVNSQAELESATTVEGSYYQKGWMYKVGSSNTYAGHVCETGDILICNKDYVNGFQNDDWDAIQEGDNSVTYYRAGGNATVDHIATFANTNGKIIKDSGKSVVANLNTVNNNTLPTTSAVKTELNKKTDGPNSSHDNAVVIFDGTTGKVVKESPLFVDPSNNSISMGRKAYDASDATTVTGQRSVATGDNVSASGDSSHAEGRNTEASGPRSHAEGDQAKATGSYSHAEGDYTLASGTRSHAEGHSTKAVGTSSHAEGDGTIANGDCAHAEGNKTIADAHWSHAEGNETIAAGQESHAEGITTRAFGMASHAEGDHTITVSMHSHVGGRYNVPFGMAKAPDWKKNTDYKREQPVKNDGHYYICYTAHTSGETFDSTKWTELGVAEDYAEVIGNGDYLHYTRSNARALDWNGNEYLAGDAYVNCEANSTGGNKVATENYVVQWMNYVPMAVESFNITSPTNGLAEIGSTVTSVTFGCKFNKTPKNTKLDNSDQTITLDDKYKGSFTKSVSLTNNKTWTLAATDIKPDTTEDTASKTTTLSFVRAVFYGAAGMPSTINSAFVRSLTKVCDADGKYTFEANAVPDASTDYKYIWYCSTVTCKFNVGGFDGGFETPVEVNVADGGGSNTVKYYVYRSTNPNLGKQTVTVK